MCSPGQLENGFTPTDENSDFASQYETKDDPDYTPSLDEIYSSYNGLEKPMIYEFSKSEKIDIDLRPALVESQRYRRSIRGTSAVMSRMLEGINAIAPTSKHLVVTPTHVQRQRVKSRKALSEMYNKNISSNITSFFFDGKKDRNLNLIERAGRKVKDSSILYDNITIVLQPGDNFLGFVSTEKTTALEIFEKMKDFFERKKMDLNNIVAIGSDAENTNTGWENGVIQHFEKHLNKSVHWIVCLLHLVEIILKAVCTLLYGFTKAPNTFAGTIQNDLANCHKMKVVAFEPVTLNNMPDKIDLVELRSDQKYFFELLKAIEAGFVSDSLASYTPPRLDSVRWLGEACRFLRLYV